MDRICLDAHIPDAGDVAGGGARFRPTASVVEDAVRTLILAAGDDPAREGLAETPARVARAFGDWFAGYRVDPARLLDRLFTETAGYGETVLLRDIPLASMCEHHLAPITGRAHIAYRPNGRVVGISKLSRLVEAYARRLQLQERLTRQIATAIEDALAPRGVAVLIEASHACLSTRGVKHHGSSLVTKCWLGDFEAEASLRQELMLSLAAGREAPL